MVKWWNEALKQWGEKGGANLVSGEARTDFPGVRRVYKSA